MNDEAKHYSFVETVRAVAKSNWGRKQPSLSEAVDTLGKDYLATIAAGILDLVRRMEQIAQAFARDYDDPRPDNKVGPIPQNAKKFPDAKVGDLLYHCDDLERGIERYVVVGIRPDGLVRIVGEEDADWAYQTAWACNWMYATEKEAFAAMGKQEVQYHGPRSEYARKLLDVLAKDGDLTPFRTGEGYPED